MPTESHGYNAWFDSNIPGGGLAVANQKLAAQYGNGLYSYGGSTPGSSQKMVFAPSLRFAYRPLEGGSTVIRGGYGIFFDQNEREFAGGDLFYPLSVTPSYNGIPGTSTTPQSLLRDTNLFPRFSTPGPVTASVLRATTFTIGAAHNKNPYNQQFTLSVEQGKGSRREVHWLQCRRRLRIVGSQQLLHLKYDYGCACGERRRPTGALRAE